MRECGGFGITTSMIPTGDGVQGNCNVAQQNYVIQIRSHLFICLSANTFWLF